MPPEVALFTKCQALRGHSEPNPGSRDPLDGTCWTALLADVDHMTGDDAIAAQEGIAIRGGRRR